YDLNPVFPGNWTDVFTSDPNFDGLFISDLNILDGVGQVPDFSLDNLIAGEYDIEILRTYNIDTDNDGILDGAIECSVGSQTIVIDEPTSINVPDPTQTSFSCWDVFPILSTPEASISVSGVNGGTPFGPNGPDGVSGTLDDNQEYIYEWKDPLGIPITNETSLLVSMLDDLDGEGVLNDLSFLMAGFYTLIVTDSEGCQSEEVSVEVEASFISEASVIADNVTLACAGGLTDVSIGLECFDIDCTNMFPPYTLEWTDLNGGPQYVTQSSNLTPPSFELLNVAEGFYNAIITDNNGCQAPIQEVSISVDPDGQVIAFPVPVGDECGSSSVMISYGDPDCLENIAICIQNGNPPFTYEWLNPGGIDLGYSLVVDSINLDLTDPLTPPGTYTVIINDLECGDTAVEFEVDDPNNKIPIVSFDSPELPCFDSVTDLEISIDPPLGFFGVAEVTVEFNNIDTIVQYVNQSLDFCIDPVTEAFDESLSNPNSMTIAFTNALDGQSVIDFSLFSIGDVIGVFYTGANGGRQCGGSVVFDGIQFTLAANAYDNTDQDDDGFLPGENILYYYQSGGQIYELIIEEYEEGGVTNFIAPDTFISNGLAAITSISQGDPLSLESSVMFPNITPGIYEINVISNDEIGNQGCDQLLLFSDLIEVESISEISLEETITNVFCYQEDDGDITLDIAGGSPPYSYNWTALNGGVIPAGQE
ncbi:SprB repeat-containing protein, partial [Flavobacteriales bacterium]|nr:SprB repeat-containing protein [Flavobacteriales bacterium]